MTPRRPIGMRQKRGGSHRESSLLPIGRLGVIYDSQPHGYALFLEIRIRGKLVRKENKSCFPLSHLCYLFKPTYIQMAFTHSRSSSQQEGQRILRYQRQNVVFIYCYQIQIIIQVGRQWPTLLLWPFLRSSKEPVSF
jgi:hypothetical protein